MCGIVGLFAKSPEIEERLGVHLAAMLAQMTDRGPDSAGRRGLPRPGAAGSSKLTLYSRRPARGLARGRARARATRSAARPSRRVRASHAVFVVDAEAAEAEAWVREQPARPARDERRAA